MRYQLYVYGTTAATGSALAIGAINASLGNEEERTWKHNEAAHFMKEFDVESIKAKIELELKGKCRVVIKLPPRSCEQKEYLYIATSYEQVREVLPRVYAIAAENGLALYDAEKERSFYLDLVDETFVSLKTREREIRDSIFRADKKIWDYKKISYYEDERDKRSVYVVTLRKVQGMSFEERIQQFYNTLKETLVNGEELICENGCFTVVGKWYAITYCLEAYKKHANMIGYFEGGRVCVKVLNRMSCCAALKCMEGFSDTEKNDICMRMNFREMVSAYPNPAERFVKSVNITKWQRKELFDIRYSGMGCYGSDIIFHIVRDDFEMEEISVLKIEEESATFILPFVADVYPYIYDRYYLTENHLPSEMWEKVCERISNAKEMILHDTFNPALKPYIKRFNLFVLSKELNDDFWENGDGYRIKNEPEKFLYEHRYDVAHLYDVFIEWSEAQLKYYCECRDVGMFNIQGP